MADWIALGLLIVAGVSAAGTIVAMVLNYRGSERRLVHEAAMQREQLASENRRANLAAAAKAYRLAAEVERKINWSIIEEGALIGADELPSVAKSTVLAAADAMELARAYGWNDKVLDAAGKVLIELASLEQCAYRSLWQLQSRDENDEAYKMFSECYDRYDSALGQFRIAINE